MKNDVVHISFRGDDDTLSIVRESFDRIPRYPEGFNFKHGYATYDYNGNMKVLILEPTTRVAYEQIVQIVNSCLNINDHSYLQIVVFCEGNSSGDIIKMA